MKTTSCLHRKFFSRPSIRELVPDLKLLLAVLTTACETHIGVYVPSGLGEDCGLDPAALAGGLEDLQRRSLIKIDPATGEIFLRQWFRDNTFKTAQRRGQAHDDFRLIESKTLQDEVLKAVEKSSSCGLEKADFLQKQRVTYQGEGKGKGKHNHYSSGGGGEQKPSTPKSETPAAAATEAGDGEAGQEDREETLRAVSLADSCLPYQQALATAVSAAGLNRVGTQKLVDALAGALTAPMGDPARLKRRGNPERWLAVTANAIKVKEFIENGSYLAAVAQRQARQATEPETEARRQDEQRQRLAASAAAVPIDPAVAAAGRALLNRIGGRAAA